MTRKHDPLVVQTPDELHAFTRYYGMPMDSTVLAHFQDVLATVTETDLVEKIKSDTHWAWVVSRLLHVEDFMRLAVRAKGEIKEDIRKAQIASACRQISTAVAQLEALAR